MRRFCWGMMVLLLLLGAFSAQAAPVALLPHAQPFSPSTPLLEIWACDLANADCFLLRCGEETLLLDCGTAFYAPRILSFLEERGVTSLTAAANSHPHDDHMGGFPKVLSQVPASEFWTAFPLDQEMDETIQQVSLEAIQALGIPLVSLENGGKYTLGDACITVYWNPAATDANSRSAIMKVTFGEASILFPGDAEGDSLTTLCRTLPLQADVLKYPHHARLPLSEDTLDSIGPSLVVIPNGPLGSFLTGLQLERRGTPAFCAASGVVYLATDGQRWVAGQP